MRILSITLDGFKSYSNKTRIDGFDENFNAITGINGTGKSNILDAIVFVLGLSNLARVRVSSSAGLISITSRGARDSASVTIEFLNYADVSKRPEGYENCDKIIVTRLLYRKASRDGQAPKIESRYTINGVNVTNAAASEMFISAHLNVNNPNFVIMQGTVMKVVDMNPKETLSLIEEAAGTRSLTLKISALHKSIKNKELAIRNALSEVQQIYPMMKAAMSAYEKYKEYQKYNKEFKEKMEECNRFGYCDRKQKKNMLENKLKEIENHIPNLKEEKTTKKEEINIMNEKVKTLQENDKQFGDKLKENQKRIRKAEMEVKDLSNNCKRLEQECVGYLNEMEGIRNQIKEEKSIVASKLNEKNKYEEEYRALEMKIVENEQKVKEIGDKINMLTRDYSPGEQQRQEIENSISKNVNDLQTYRDRMTRIEDELKVVISDRDRVKGDEVPSKTSERLNTLLDEQRTLQEELDNLNFDQNTMLNLMKRHDELVKHADCLRRRVDGLKSSRTVFEYTDPYVGFDRTSVFGMLIELFKVEKEKYLCAVEKTASAKLFNVVLRSADVGEELLKKKHLLKHRVVFVPIDKLRGSAIDNQTYNRAKKLVGEENVVRAIDLIKSDSRYTKVMVWAFGNTLICCNNDHATTLAYHESVKTKCVTIGGDVYETSGIVYGGGRTDRRLALKEFATFVQATLEHIESVKQLSDLENEISNEHKKCDTYKRLMAKLEDLKPLIRKLEILNEFNENVKKLNEQKDDIKNNINTCENEIAELKSKLESLKKKNSSTIRKKEIEELEKEKSKINDIISKNKNILTSLIEKIEANDIEGCNQSIDMELKGLQEKENHLVQEQEKLNLLKLELENKKKEALVIEEEFENEKREINERNVEINEMVERKAVKEKELKELESQIDQKEEEYKYALKKIEKLSNEMEEMESRNEYLTTEEFVRQIRYMDQSGENEMKYKNEVVALKENRVKFEEWVNLDLLEYTEEFRDIVSGSSKILEQSKEEIKLIEELLSVMEAHKTQLLEKAWETVNNQFNSIFTLLLPGVNAKLKWANERDINQGLEMQVNLGAGWSSALGSLSGGQKSLVALSFILAISLYRPAPIYILDEVDAALDLSHTQNFGNMLSAHFKNSQFLIISLKEGMFSRANVIFRTKLVDSASTVTRTVNPR